jgi:hypothetical protein
MTLWAFTTCYNDSFFFYLNHLSLIIHFGQGRTKETGNRNFRELLSVRVEHMLLNGAAQIEETALPFAQFALLHSVTCVQLRPITVLGNCDCVAVASFFWVPSPLGSV